MWLIVTSRLRTWLIFAIAVPATTMLVRVIRTRVQAKNPDSRVASAMKAAEDSGTRRGRRGRRSSHT